MQIVVLGMHRSGTSSITHLIHAAGAYFGSLSSSTGANAENPKGFWERRDVRRICDRLLQGSGFDWWKIEDFSVAAIPDDLVKECREAFDIVLHEMDAHRPWVMKEPRLSLLLPVLVDRFEHPVVVVALRHPWEVAKSLLTRNGIPISVGLALWEKYTLAALENSAAAPTHIADYNRLIEDPEGETRKLLQFLSASCGKDATFKLDRAADVIDTELRRETTDDMPPDVAGHSAVRLYREIRGDVPREDARRAADQENRLILRVFEEMGGVEILNSPREIELLKRRWSEERARVDAISRAREALAQRLREQRQAAERQRRAAESTARVLRAELAQAKRELDVILHSTTWRVTAPLRRFGRRFPALTRFARRTAKLAWWTISLQLPARLRERYPKFRRALSSKSVSRKVIPKLRHVLRVTWEPSPDIAEMVAQYQAGRQTPKRFVVYTAIAGGYDQLLVPDKLDPEFDYVCFTDGPINGYGVWHVRPLPYHHPDPTRRARYVKTHPHLLFPRHEAAIWVDANILIRGEVRAYVDTALGSRHGAAFISHPQRTCLYEEAEACKELKKDDPECIDRQTERYRRAGIAAGSGMFETNFFAVSLREPLLRQFFRIWWNEIAEYSRRDQLSIIYALQQSGVQPVALLPQGLSVRNHEDFRIFRHTESRSFAVPRVLADYEEISDPLAGPRYAERGPEHGQARSLEIDIIVCVYNALEDVRLCLSSARESLRQNHRLIIVNDRSNEETTSFLRNFAAGQERIELLENEQNLGYTRTANRGLAHGRAPLRILLNSDTLVCAGWAEKIAEVAFSSEQIGIVGPMSNAASWQSIPDVRGTRGQTAINPLPEGITVEDMDRACERWSLAHDFPIVPLVHGFCYAIKQDVIDAIGLFDEENFDRFYGEENDYCFRAAQAGFELAIATNTFVFHKKSMSIGEEERQIWMTKAGETLRRIHGREKVALAVQQMAEHPLLEHMRDQARLYYADKRSAPVDEIAGLQSSAHTHGVQVAEYAGSPT